MALDLQEQEQVAQFKAWWNAWGKYFVTVILLLVVTYLGFKGWQTYQISQAEKVSTLFFGLEKNGDDTKKVLATVKMMMEQYPSSPYTARAALIGAKVYLLKKDISAAEVQLQWVVQHAKEPNLRDIAHLRLAAIFLDTKKYEQALNQLKQAEDESDRVAFLEMKGDVFVESGKNKEAVEAYKQAYAQAKNDFTYRKLIEIKMDAVGSVNK